MARNYQRGRPTEEQAAMRRAAYARRVAEGRDGATNRYRQDPDYRQRRIAQCLDAQRRRNFGLSQAQYDEMLAAQNGRCAICTDPASGNLDVDHDHETGVVRGLLCRSCNLGLGKFKDDQSTVLMAAEYLGQHNKKREVIPDDLGVGRTVRRLQESRSF